MIGQHEVLLTVWNYNKICDNLSFFKIKTHDLPSVFSQKEKKIQVPVHDNQFLGRGTYRPVTLEFLELGLLIANQIREYCYSYDYRFTASCFHALPGIYPVTSMRQNCERGNHWNISKGSLFL